MSHANYSVDLNAESAARIAADSAISGSLTAHENDVANPHLTTAAQVGADPVGSASTAVANHVAAVDPHPQYGLLEAMFGPHYVAGAWFHTVIATTSSTLVATPGWLFLTPTIVSRSATWDRVRFEVTIAGTADVVVRLGIYAYDLTTGRPGALLATFGSISNPSPAAIYELTINHNITPGWYYIGLLATGTVGPTIRGAASSLGNILGTSAMSPSIINGSLVQTGQATLPDPPVITVGNSVIAPMVDVRIGTLN